MTIDFNAGRNAWEPLRSRGMDTQSFVDDSFEIGQLKGRRCVDLFKRLVLASNFIGEFT